MEIPKNGERRRYIFSLTIALLFTIDTIVRLWKGQEVDEKLCWAFVICFGLVFGANIKDWVRK